MIGAIAGDIIGHKYEFNNIETPDFELFPPDCSFTDDTVLTVATADAILGDKNYLSRYQEYFTDYPGRGWGGMFAQMASTGELGPYGSYGNGSAMRVSPVGWYATHVEEVLLEAYNTAVVTHDHYEGIKGAQSVALAIWMARNGFDKDEISHSIRKRFDYDISRPYTEYGRAFDETCQGTLPKAFAIFLQTKTYEEAIRQSIAQGGDVDTIACIVGGMAQAFYGMPPRNIVVEAYSRLNHSMQETVTIFTQLYIDPNFRPPVFDAAGLVPE